MNQLEGIHDRDSGIGREHFELYRNLFMPHVPQTTWSGVFNNCVDANPEARCNFIKGEWVEHTPPASYPSLVVCQREQLGLLPYPIENLKGKYTRTIALAQFAIVAGSLADLDIKPREPEPTAQEKFLMGLVAQLQIQLA